jgi:uncharacterized protein
MRINHVLLATALLVGPCAVHAQVASFNCAKAATPTEKAICQTPSLGAKDIRMATYFQVLQDAPPGVGGMGYREFRDGARTDQVAWVRQKRNTCQGDVGCLESAYDRRLDALRKLLADNLALTYGQRCQD